MLRRFMTVAMGLFALGMLVARAEAAEFEGFGPIKFGMTKDEAWAAIEGKGEWLDSGTLRYERPSGDPHGKLVVEQEFENRQAANVSVVYSLRAGTRDYCLAKGVHFAAVIESKYRISPLTRYGTAEPLEPWKEGSKLFDVEDIYAFVFDDGAAIQFLAKYTFGKPDCVISFLYLQPNDFVIPF